jgi:hypothetical protein
MDTLRAIERLIQHARREHVPSFNVADKVLLSIMHEETETVSFLPMGLFAGITAVAAFVMLFLAINSWLALTDPITELITPFQEMPLW